MMPPRARPEMLDTMVEMWLASAVGMAAMMTAPFNAFRPEWPENPDAEVGEGEGEIEATTVSPVRPSDLAAPAEAGLAANETCGNCRHFYRANAQAGECRRSAPFVAAEGARAEWPVVMVQQWCGAFYHAHVPGLTKEDRDGLH